LAARVDLNQTIFRFRGINSILVETRSATMVQTMLGPIIMAFTFTG
jgi:hypothetical protein